MSYIALVPPLYKYIDVILDIIEYYNIYIKCMICTELSCTCSQHDRFIACIHYNCSGSNHWRKYSSAVGLFHYLTIHFTIPLQEDFLNEKRWTTNTNLYNYGPGTLYTQKIPRNFAPYIYYTFRNSEVNPYCSHSHASMHARIHTNWRFQ